MINFEKITDMNLKLLTTLSVLFYSVLLFSQEDNLFNDYKVNKIYVTMPQDSLNYMIDNLVNNEYLYCQFRFEDGVSVQTLDNVGIRLRGNSSLIAQKKSFKFSFNKFDGIRKFQGVKKLNLIGSHNDPSCIRQKLFYDIWNRYQTPIRRVSFAELYINNVYRGLYSVVEEMDKEWIQRNYDFDEGNLYKCTYPSDLDYISLNQDDYKSILNSPDERAYDLKTNETLDDYSDLVRLIKNLNQPYNEIYIDSLSSILNINNVLKAYALEIATGHWDDYFYNKNNFFLYHNLENDRFDFVSYDVDNTCGVDWVGQDWAVRDVFNWGPDDTSQKRPLGDRLLAIPEYKHLFVKYLDTITTTLTKPEIINQRIDSLKSLVTSSVLNDTYRGLDWGYDNNDFFDSFTHTIDGHTPYGVKPFFQIRYDSTLAQINRYYGTVDNTEIGFDHQFMISPNPCQTNFEIHFIDKYPSENVTYCLNDIYGHVIQCGRITNNDSKIDVTNLQAGMYFIQVKIDKNMILKKFIKI